MSFLVLFTFNLSSAADCSQAWCGDGICQPECGETASKCPYDCYVDPCENAWCGDGICQPECGETASKCPHDCYVDVTADIKANNSNGPITVSYKSNVTLSWTSENASFCQASGDWSGERDPFGNETINMREVKTHNFIITCSYATSTATDSVVVNVRANPPTVITLPAVITY